MKKVRVSAHVISLWSLCAITTTTVPGCGHSSADDQPSDSRTAVTDTVYRRHRRRVSDFDKSSGAKSMGLSSEMGVYDASDVEGVIRERFGEIRGCYAQGHVRNKVTLRFEVDATGKPTEVAIVEGKLGNRNVERCLFRVSMNLRFPPPIGNRPAIFEYPLELAPARSLKTG